MNTNSIKVELTEDELKMIQVSLASSHFPSKLKEHKHLIDKISGHYDKFFESTEYEFN